MSQRQKLFLRLLSGRHDQDFAFSDLQAVLSFASFTFRTRGDHFIYTRADVEEIINIQPRGNKAKPYQVKQVREILLTYRIGGDEDEI